MSAQSVTGRGSGASNTFTTKDLATLANGPSIIFSGIVESDTGNLPISPEQPCGAVVFPYALPGGADKYVVMLTTINAGSAYVFSRTEDDGNFTGFEFISENEGQVMYLVSRVGSRPNL